MDDDEVMAETEVDPPMDAPAEEIPSGNKLVTSLVVIPCGTMVYGFALYTVFSAMIFPASIKPFLRTNITRQGKHNPHGG